jgi:Polysulphide reductase, NrfD
VSEVNRSYHGQPVLKEPIWTWEIPTYFFTGGLAGASAGLAYLTELRGNEVLARRAWATALGGIAVSPLFLISDLGRPMRFLNMLRMFKVTSPMSVGSWILAASGATTALAALDAWTGLLPRAGRFAKPTAALLGLPLSTYTAALIANTAVPVWHESHRLLPFVYGSGAALTAGATVAAITPPEHAAPARRLSIVSALVEVGVKELMHHRLGEHGEPYRQGAGAKFSHVSRACNLAGSALMYARGARSRRAAMAAGALMCVGALSARWSTYRAGFESASDPKYVVGPQRAGIEEGRRSGAARRNARVATGQAGVPDVDRTAGSPAAAPVALD